MKNIKKAIYYLSTILESILVVFIIIIALVNISMFVQYKLFSNPVPTIFGYSYVNILSGSMEPVISEGDLAICKGQENYSVGDVVIFEDDGHIILHRIVDEKNGLFITQGDANNVPDKNQISSESIYGTLVYTFKGWGENLTYFTNGIGAFWLIAATFFIFLAIDNVRDYCKCIAFEKSNPKKETVNTTINRDNNPKSIKHKKQSLIIIPLIFCICTTVLGGQARYISKTEGSSSVKAASFTIDASLSSQGAAINLFNPEKIYIGSVTVTNQDNGDISDVAVKYSINISPFLVANPLLPKDGISFELCDGSNMYTTTATEDGFVFESDKFVFLPGEAQSNSYDIYICWTSDFTVIQTSPLYVAINIISEQID